MGRFVDLLAPPLLPLEEETWPPCQWTTPSKEETWPGTLTWDIDMGGGGYFSFVVVAQANSILLAADIDNC